MKRIVPLIALIIVAVIALTGCSPLTVLSANEFTSRMEAEGHIVEDITHIAQVPEIESMFIAHTGAFEVEFIVFGSEQYARSTYNGIVRNFEDGRGSASSHSSTSIANFSRFRQTTSGRFEMITRVENTILISVTSAENRDYVTDIFDLLGY
ncbi:MAG: hypothetical protein FWD05_03960 [Oscillospiraceae bacterium]|nr:hypothetical protein [Oscillospiraceae bacterium]